LIDFRNPFTVVINIFTDMYPDKSCKIEFVQELYKKEKAYGGTHFPGDGSNPTVSIDVTTPVIGAVEVLAHELSHVAVGEKKGHGEEWEKVFDDIYNEFNKRGEEPNQSLTGLGDKAAKPLTHIVG